MKIRKFLKNLQVRSIEAFKTFPSSMLIIAVAFGLIMYNIWAQYNDITDIINKVTMTLWLILPLFTAVHLFRLRTWLLPLVALLGVAFYYGTGDIYYQTFAMQAILFGIATYGTLFTLPHWKDKNNMGLWQYMGSMSFALCLGLVSSAILSGSVNLAFVSIEQLFDVFIDSRIYETTMIFGFFFFLPIFVHMWLPLNWRQLNKNTHVPQFLRPLSYYLLVPIFFLYLAILSAYVVKILYTGVWPSGEVAYPVLFFSILFFAFYFISHPWEKKFNKWGFAAILPFILVYFTALYQRIDQYGVTELRYLGVGLGLALLICALYFLISQKKRFQTFAIVISVGAFLSIVGPWSAIEVSLNSQQGRLEALLQENGLLVDGKLVQVADISGQTQSEISGLVYFFDVRDAMDKISPWGSTGETVDAISFMDEMGLEYNQWGYFPNSNSNSFDYYKYPNSPITISDYDFMFQSSGMYDRAGFEKFPENTSTWTWQDHEVGFSMDENGNITVTYDDGEPVVMDVLALKERLDNGDFNPSESPELFALEGENDEIAVRFVFNSINGLTGSDGSLNNLYVDGYVLVDVK